MSARIRAPRTEMLVDSHCHLDFPEFAGRIDEVRAEMASNGVSHALCVCVSISGFARVVELAETYENFYASAGVHPDQEDQGPLEPSVLCRLASRAKVVAIGETGLDYYRVHGDQEWQRQRFRSHIRAARECGKPLIIHTREAGADTLRIMKEEGAVSVGGVMHCFTESKEVADAAIQMGFFVSFSGIITFKNAAALREVAKAVPMERLLVETDAPYLAPVPYRGKTNRPGLVKYVAEEIARIKGLTLDAVTQTTSDNFFRLFKLPDADLFRT